MSYDVIDFSHAEIAPPADFTAIGVSGRAASDALSVGALGWPAHWARITVTQISADIVSVSPGEYYEDGIVFASKAAIQKNLQTYKPVTGTDERWVALILRGTDVEETALRQFETSAEPLKESIPVNRETPKRRVRAMSVVIQSGEIAPPPAFRPAVAESDCCVAFVRLKSTGIQEIVPNEPARVKTAAEIDGRLADVEVRVTALYEKTAAIETNLAGLAANQRNFASKVLVGQIAGDVARTRQLLNFPAAARNYYFDQGLIPDFWDLTHPLSLVRIKEGFRHPYASVSNSQLQLLNPTNADVVKRGNRVIPAFTEVVRLESPVGAGRQDISNVVHTVTTATEHQASYESIRYGETIYPCENTAGWENLSQYKAGQIFAANGQEFIQGGLSEHPWGDDRAGHQVYAVQGVIRDYYSYTYVTYDTKEYGLSGAIYGQTLLNAQLMVMTSIDLYFTRVGPTGDVTLVISKLTPSGAPDYQAIIAKAVKPVAELSEGWVNIDVPFTLLEPGQRYAWFVVTSGNHQLATTTANAFAGGSKFVSSDGVWSQGSTTEDFSFRLYGAKFGKSRTVVEMQAINLAGGMSEFQLVHKGWAPEGTQRSWEILPIGAAEWIPVDARFPNPLANLPAQCGLRMIMQGTNDIAPMIELDTDARVVAGRLRADMRAISQELTFGFSTETVSVVLNQDNYDPDHHDVAIKLIVAGSTIDPDSVTATQDPKKPSRTEIKAVFDFTGAAITSARLRLESLTDTVTYSPFGQDVQLNAF